MKNMIPSRVNKREYRIAIAALAVFSCGLLPAQAANYYWDADTPYGDGTWDTSNTNWSTSASGGTSLTWVNSSSSYAIFNPGLATPTGDTVTLTLGNDITANRLDMSSSYAADLRITTSSGYTITADHFLNNRLDHSLIIDTVISGNDIRKSNQGTVIFSQNNTYSGRTTINTGSALNTSLLQIGNGGTTGSLGLDNVQFTAATSGGPYGVSTLGFNRSDNITVNNNVLFHSTLSNVTAMDAYGTKAVVSNLSSSGNVTLTGNQVIYDGVTAQYRSESMKLTVSGVIKINSGTGGVVTAGAGTVEFSEANTYNGDTTVTEGTLLVTNTSGSGTGTGDVSVLSGATLGGTGSISGATTVAGILDPGVGGTAGSLTIDNDVAFQAGSSLAIQIMGVADYDNLVVSGDLDLGDASLNISSDYVAEIGQVFEIVSGYTGIVGTFLGLADGSEFSAEGISYQINYNSDGVVLTVTAIPEPASVSIVLALIALSCARLAVRRRAHRRVV